MILKRVVKDFELELSIGKEIGDSAGRFHPTRYVYLTHGDKPIGKIGEVHQRTINKFGLEKRVAILELSLKALQ